jgi:hypothetical protein
MTVSSDAGVVASTSLSQHWTVGYSPRAFQNGENGMTDKPAVLVTRKLPDAVEARVSRDYDARLNLDDRFYGPEEMIARAEGAVAIIPCHTETFTAEVIAGLPASVKAICNFSVGYNHVDCDAAKERGVIVTNTPDVLSDATAEIAMLCILGAARRAVPARAAGWFAAVSGATGARRSWSAPRSPASASESSVWAGSARLRRAVPGASRWTSITPTVRAWRRRTRPARSITRP